MILSNSCDYQADLIESNQNTSDASRKAPDAARRPRDTKVIIASAARKCSQLIGRISSKQNRKWGVPKCKCLSEDCLKLNQPHILCAETLPPPMAESDFSRTDSLESNASTVPPDDLAEVCSSDSDKDFQDERHEGLPAFFKTEDELACWQCVEPLGSPSASQLESNVLQYLGQHDIPLTVIYRQIALPRNRLGVVEELQASVPENVSHQIDLDVPRTQPNVLGDADRVYLRRVLRAYAAQNPMIGYCQGMSSLASVFVMLGFDEATALNGLLFLTREFCPEYFGPSLDGYIRDAYVLGVLVRTVLPVDVLHRLDSLEIPLNLLAVDHFLSLGSHQWPLSAVVLFWDLLFVEGYPCVFASFLALMQLYLPDIAVENEAPHRIECFKNAVANGVANELHLILDKTRELLPLVPKSYIESLRNIFSRCP
mmetsp:Transcript_66631/g.104138  ORF Transcript_66631/g.104138 Transcript_66631/m.104138 type:complete len:427 (+) Transcript_66631:78-1358(+)